MSTTTTAVYDGEREIGYVEPQEWEGETQYAGRLTVRGEEFVGLFALPERAAEAVRDAFRDL